MYNTRMMDYMEAHSPDVALTSNTASGIKEMQKEIVLDIILLRSAEQTFSSLGMKEEAKWCFNKAVWMAKWLIAFGYLEK